MRIVIATTQVPFIHGGADNFRDSLRNALSSMGHEIDVITMPFRFSPASEVARCIDIWSTENLERLNGYCPDQVICLAFPSYFLQHPAKKVWLMYQHRAVYDLWGIPGAEQLRSSSEWKTLKKRIQNRDSSVLKTCAGVWTISKRVSERLRQFNNIDSTALYHPPWAAESFFSRPAEPYIFFPSRLEKLKRQDLLIEAMALTRSPVYALVAGTGGRKEALQQLIEQRGLGNRVRLLGHISMEEMFAYYAHCLGVFFGPYDEDYGYVTLEAMLSEKPVITCTDSGATLEFTIDQETGFVVEPTAEAIAQAIDSLYLNQARAARMGRAGKARYSELGINWPQALEALLGDSKVGNHLTAGCTT